MTGTAATWTLQRSRAPDLSAATMVVASGAAAMASEGWLWWAGAAALAVGLSLLVASARREAVRVRLILGKRVRLERVAPGQPEVSADTTTAADQRLSIEGLLDGGSVVTPWLIALRIRGDDGRRADLVLTPGCGSPDELRRLRVRLLTDESLRA